MSNSNNIYMVLILSQQAEKVIESHIHSYHYMTKQLVFEWLNRRSQKTSFNWKGFEAYLEHYPLPEPRIVHHLYTLSFVS